MLQCPRPFLKTNLVLPLPQTRIKSINQRLIMKLNKGDIITIIGISDWMATTTRNEVKACGFLSSGKEVFTENKKGARKKFTLRGDLENYDNNKLVFRNTYPFKISGEISRNDPNSLFTVTKMSGNACINIYGTPEEIRFSIEHNNINKAFTSFDSVIALDPDTDAETPVYPEVQTEHAVVKRIREAVTHTHTA